MAERRLLAEAQIAQALRADVARATDAAAFGDKEQLAARRAQKHAAAAAAAAAAEQNRAKHEAQAEAAQRRRQETARQETARQAIAARNARSATAYRAMVSARIAAREHYPQEAMARRPAGVARVRFEIKPSGALSAVTIESSSGDGSLDGAALMAVRRAAPFPPPPPGAARVYVAPVAFRPS